MIRYRYFIRKVYSYGVGVTYQCVRVHEDDPRIPDLVKKYNDGWNFSFQYLYEPTREEEVFKIKCKFSHNIYSPIYLVDDPDKLPQLR